MVVLLMIDIFCQDCALGSTAKSWSYIWIFNCESKDAEVYSGLAIDSAQLQGIAIPKYKLSASPRALCRVRARYAMDRSLRMSTPGSVTSSGCTSRTCT